MTTPLLYQHSHWLVRDGEKMRIREQERGEISVSIGDNESVTLTLQRKAASRLIADLTAVLTLSEIADTEKEVSAT